MRNMRANMTPDEKEKDKREGFTRLEKWKRKVGYVKKGSSKRRQELLSLYPDTFTKEDWEFALEYFNYSCAYCGRTSEELQREHYVSVNDGGWKTPDNIVPSCFDCNYRKGIRSGLEFLYDEYDKETAETKIDVIGDYMENRINDRPVTLEDISNYPEYARFEITSYYKLAKELGLSEYEGANMQFAIYYFLYDDDNRQDFLRILSIVNDRVKNI